jgi:hypothetical protein
MAAATAKRNGMSAPISLRVGIWQGLFTFGRRAEASSIDDRIDAILPRWCAPSSSVGQNPIASLWKSSRAAVATLSVRSRFGLLRPIAATRQ